MKSSQSNFNLGLPGSYLARSYLIATVIYLGLNHSHLVTRSFNLDVGFGYTNNDTKCTNECAWYGDEAYYSCLAVSGKWVNCTPVFSGKPFNFKKSLI